MLLYPALVGAAVMTVAWPFFGSRLDLTWLDMAKLLMVACSHRRPLPADPRLPAGAGVGA